jgi:hypothetical protein
MEIQGQYFTEQEIRRIVLLLSETGMTIPEIAARTRCSRSAVAAINRKWKVRVPAIALNRRGRKSLNVR